MDEFTSSGCPFGRLHSPIEATLLLSTRSFQQTLGAEGVLPSR